MVGYIDFGGLAVSNTNSAISARNMRLNRFVAQYGVVNLTNPTSFGKRDPTSKAYNMVFSIWYMSYCLDCFNS